MSFRLWLESTIRTGSRFGYPDGYSSAFYPMSFKTPYSPTTIINAQFKREQEDYAPPDTALADPAADQAQARYREKMGVLPKHSGPNHIAGYTNKDGIDYIWPSYAPHPLNLRSLPQVRVNQTTKHIYFMNFKQWMENIDDVWQQRDVEDRESQQRAVMRIMNSKGLSPEEKHKKLASLKRYVDMLDRAKKNRSNSSNMCPNCGMPLEPGAVTCPYCNEPTGQETPTFLSRLKSMFKRGS